MDCLGAVDELFDLDVVLRPGACPAGPPRLCQDQVNQPRQPRHFILGCVAHQAEPMCHASSGAKQSVNDHMGLGIFGQHPLSALNAGAFRCSDGYSGVLVIAKRRQHVFTVSADASHAFAVDESDHVVLTAGAVTLATLAELAGRLPGHPEPDGDLWPPMPRSTAWSISTPSSASASSRAIRARAIRSSTWGADKWVMG